MIISEIKKEAKSSLHGNWIRSFILMFIFFILQIGISLLISLITNNTPYILFGKIVYLIFSISLSYGLTCYFIKLKNQEKLNPLYIIYFTFKDFDRFWRLIGRLFFSLSFYIICLLLCLYLVLYSYILYISGVAGLDISFVLGIIGTIAFSILLTLKTLLFALNNFILFSNENMKSKEILLESKRLMTNHRWDFFKLILSFIGWFILAISFTIGVFFLFSYFNIIVSVYYITMIPMLFITPYLIVSIICFYEALLKKSQKMETASNNNFHNKMKNKRAKK